MRYSGNCARLFSHIMTCLMITLFLISFATAQDKVVVLPLMEKCITCKGTLVGTRWCDNGDATVTDMTTGLVWLKYAGWGDFRPWRSDTPGDYDDAHQRAGLLRDGVVVHSVGISSVVLNDGSVAGDWRLPTKTELYNLANGTEAVRYGSQRAFTGVLSTYYWSSSTYAGDTNLARIVNMDDGVVDSTSKTNSFYVWPVRGGN